MKLTKPTKREFVKYIAFIIAIVITLTVARLLEQLHVYLDHNL